MRSRWRLLSIFTALMAVLPLVALAACHSQGGSTPDGGETPRPSSRIQHPSGGSDVILQVSRSGGLLTWLYHGMDFPRFTLYGDGTLIYWRPAPEGGLFKGRLTEDAIQELLQLVVRDNRFFDSKTDYTNQRVVDGLTTIFNVRADGRELTVRAYGLEPGLPDGAVPNEDREQFARLAAIQERILSLDPRIIDSPDYQWEGAWVPASLTLAVRQVEEPQAWQASPWPLTSIRIDRLVPYDRGVARIVLMGEDAQTLVDNFPYGQYHLVRANNATFGMVYKPHLPYDGSPLELPLPPHIASISPEDGSAVSNEEPIVDDDQIGKGVCATFQFQPVHAPGMGDTPLPLIAMFVDQVDVTAVLGFWSTEDLPPSQGGVCYAPPAPLSPGPHVVTLRYRDLAGGEYAYTWRITILEDVQSSASASR